jgi:hypothetical protein
MSIYLGVTSAIFIRISSFADATRNGRRNEDISTCKPTTAGDSRWLMGGKLS